MNKICDKRAYARFALFANMAHQGRVYKTTIVSDDMQSEK